MNRIFRLTLSFCFLLTLRTAFADETRVDSTGNLNLIISDETADINPYTLGNPAGLALLPEDFRLELNANDYSNNTASNSQIRNNFNLNPSIPAFPNLNTVNTSYNFVGGEQHQGLIYINPDHWAVQASGSFMTSSNQTDPNPTINNSGTNEFLQMAYDFGSLTVGTSLFSYQFSTNVNDPTSANGLSSNTGFLVNVPLESGKNPTWLRWGGTFQFEILPIQNIYDLIPDTLTYQMTDLNFEPSVYLEIPGSFQAALIADIYSDSLSRNNLPYENGSAWNLSALYKWKIFLTPSGDIHPLTLNNGMLFELNPNQTNYLQTLPPDVQTEQITSLQYQGGVGLEREKDFTFGLQGTINTVLNTASSAEASVVVNNAYFWTLAIGGEKWINPDWALRLGLTYLNENNPGGSNNGSTDSFQFIYINPGDQITGLMISGGIGYRSKHFEISSMAWYESPETSSIPSSTFAMSSLGPNYSYTIFGGQLSATYFFDR